MPETLLEIPTNLSTLTRSLVTEDENPVDNLFSAKQRRLLVEPLYSSWQPPALESETEEAIKPRVFLADSDVGIFISPYKPPIAPDMFLSLDVQANAEYFENEHRAYFIWEFAKTPEVALEVVSNRKGKEMGDKMQRYAQLGIPYYIVFDPFLELSDEKLRTHELAFGGRRYRRLLDHTLPDMDLSLRLWRGVFEGVEAEWLRWCKADGTIIPTGEERAKVANELADAETARANTETARADTETARADTETARANTEAARADTEKAARLQAEAEIEKLRAELLQLKSE